MDTGYHVLCMRSHDCMHLVDPLENSQKHWHSGFPLSWLYYKASVHMWLDYFTSLLFAQKVINHFELNFLSFFLFAQKSAWLQAIIFAPSQLFPIIYTCIFLPFATTDMSLTHWVSACKEQMCNSINLLSANMYERHRVNFWSPRICDVELCALCISHNPLKKPWWDVLWGQTKLWCVQCTAHGGPCTSQP